MFKLQFATSNAVFDDDNELTRGQTAGRIDDENALKRLAVYHCNTPGECEQPKEPLAWMVDSLGTVA